MPPTPGATPSKRLRFLDGGDWDETPAPAEAAGNTPAPAVGVAQSPSKESAAAAVEKLKQEIAELWLHGRERRIALGRKLRELRTRCASRDRVCHGGRW